MSARTTHHRLQVDAAPGAVHRHRSAARHGISRPASGPALTPLPTTWRPRTARCWPSATGCRPRSTPGTRPTRGRLPTCRPTRRLPDAHRLPRGAPRGSRRPRRTWMPSWHSRPGRNWWCHPERAMRSTPPMRAGARSMTRSTAPTPCRAWGATRPVPTTRVRGAQVIALRPPRAGPGRAAGRGLARRRRGLPRRGWATRRRAQDGAAHAWPTRPPSPATRALPPAPAACSSSTTACTWTCASTVAPPLAPATRPAWPTWC